MTHKEYAVQIKWPDPDGWMFETVGHPGGERRPAIYDSFKDAEDAAAIWSEGSTRVVERAVGEWREAEA